MLWLYDEFETDFTYNGIVLNNAYDSDIHWVLNTMYKLTFKYPTVDNDLFSFIEKGMIVKADEHDRTNLFRIKDIDISENDKCITVTAYQKNYDFSKRLVNNFGRLRVNCMSVLDEWYSNFLSSEKDFSYYSDINAINSFVSHNDDTDNKLRTSFELLGGIADTYSADIDMHDKQISLLERLGRDTEEVLTTAKNISEFVNTSNSDEIVTRIYASSTFKVGDKYDKKDLREQHRQQLKVLRESQKEYSQGRNAVKKAEQMKDEIAKKYAKELAKNNKKVKRSGKVIKSYSQIESEVNAKYQERERKSQQRKAESQAIADRKKAEIESLKAQQKEELEALDEEITINLIVESPLINDYPFINEIAVSNNDLRTAEELEEWAMEYFTKQNIDKPKNSIKVTYEQLSEDINRGDTVILKYLKYGVDERIRVVETHYDPMLKKWKEFILGEKEGRLGSEVAHSTSGAEVRANAYTDRLSMDIDRRVEERSKNYDELFKKNTDEINKKIEDGFEKAKASSEVTIAKIDEDLEKKLAPIRNQVSATVENYNRQFQATNLEISKNRVEATKQIQAANLEISNNRIEATKQIQVLSDRVNNMQDISSNSTVVELKKLVNEAKETGRSINQKVTELEGNVTREFTSVKAKNENDLKVIRGEIKTGVDGLTSKINSLEEYKNQDGSRTESLKQWVQRDTASQLSRERTEINKVIDSKGFVKNTEFSSKFTENARGITNQLTALENYKNQDGVRTANLQIWVQNNTANQLTAERRSIEGWVDGKGYATTSVVENKVQETANSFSREISNVRNSIPTSVGGRNYITDSDKLNAKPHWGSNKWDETVDGDTIILTKKGGSDNTGFWFALTDLVKTQFQNETLTWSIDVKASREMTLNTVGFETNGLRRVDISTQWKRMSHTFINKFTNYYAFVFYHPTTNFNNGDKIYIRLPKLEIGNVATDWTPAPEDNNAFVKNTEFSNKFTENARSINNQLSALETYKNQDGVRVANMQIWVQNNTANQLTAARRSIESWVNEKGYATNSVVENKVRETANSFSREISNVRESIPTSLGGRNYILNSGEPLKKEGHSWGGDWEVRTHPYYYNGNKKIMCLPNSTTRENFIRTPRFKLKRNTDYVISFKGFASGNVSSMDLHVLGRRNNETSDFTIFTRPAPIINSRKLSPNGLEVVKNIRFNSGEMDEAYLRFDNNGSTNNQQAILFITEVKLEEGVISTDWTPAPEDEQQSINELNSWKQTTIQTLNAVSSSLNDTVRHSQLRIGADGIDFGSNKVFNGRNLASILSVSPESIQAITDRLVISPANENLVKHEYRNRHTLVGRDVFLNKIYGGNELAGDYYFAADITAFDARELKAMIHVKYTDGTNEWLENKFPSTDFFGGTQETTVKVPLKSNKTIEFIEPIIFQPRWSNFDSYILGNIKVYKKKSAELIVDGSIEGRHIKTNTLETGHHKAGSITSEIIAANAVRAKHILIDDGLITNLVTHNAFISKLWAQDAFIRSLKTVKITSTQIDTESLRGKTIIGGTIDGGVIKGNVQIKLGEHGFLQPIEQGLQINAPKTYNANSGVGFQLHGYKKTLSNGNIIPKGVFIYNDDNFATGDVVSTANETLLTVEGMIRCRSMSDGNGKYHSGYAVPTITTFNANNSGLYPIFDIYHQDDYRGQFFLYSVPGKYFSVATKAASDKKLKKNIRKTKEIALKKIDRIEFKSFDWREESKGHEKLGMIAQELEKIESKFVDLIIFKDGEERYTLNTDILNIYSLKAIQELSAENKELKQKIIKLEELING